VRGCGRAGVDGADRERRQPTTAPGRTTPGSHRGMVERTLRSQGDVRCRRTAVYAAGSPVAAGRHARRHRYAVRADRRCGDAYLAIRRLLARPLVHGAATARPGPDARARPGGLGGPWFA